MDNPKPICPFNFFEVGGIIIPYLSPSTLLICFIGTRKFHPRSKITASEIWQSLFFVTYSGPLMEFPSPTPKHFKNTLNHFSLTGFKNTLNHFSLTGFKNTLNHFSLTGFHILVLLCEQGDLAKEARTRTLLCGSKFESFLQFISNQKLSIPQTRGPWATMLT